jgi:3-hydroxyacyl-[acyl-carrier-protein] dehydratase
MRKLSKKEIKDLLPHREPMLLIDEIYDIKKLSSATGVVNVTEESFFFKGHFPGTPIMPGVLIIEAFGQAAAALTADGLDKSVHENKLVFLMGVEKARFRNPVTPNCKLLLKIKAIRTHGRVWKYSGEAFVDEKKMADAIWSATIVDK